MQHRAGSQRDLVAARRALPQQPLAEQHGVAAAAPRTPVSLGRTGLDEVLTAGVVVRKPALKLNDAAREVRPRHLGTLAE
jgi:hypothetical protein